MKTQATPLAAILLSSLLGCSEKDAIEKVRTHSATNEVVPLPGHSELLIARREDGSIWFYKDRGACGYTDGGHMLFGPVGGSPYIPKKEPTPVEQP